MSNNPLINHNPVPRKDLKKGKLYLAYHSMAASKRMRKSPEWHQTDISQNDGTLISFEEPRPVLFLGISERLGGHYHLIIDDMFGWLTIYDLSFEEMKIEE